MLKFGFLPSHIFFWTASFWDISIRTTLNWPTLPSLEPKTPNISTLIKTFLQEARQCPRGHALWCVSTSTTAIREFSTSHHPSPTDQSIWKSNHSGHIWQQTHSSTAGYRHTVYGWGSEAGDCRAHSLPWGVSRPCLSCKITDEGVVFPA